MTFQSIIKLSGKKTSVCIAQLSRLEGPVRRDIHRILELDNALSAAIGQKIYPLIIYADSKIIKVMTIEEALTDLNRSRKRKWKH